ncbi:MAG: NUDIX domain-containing protein [Deltaproteobacteria bacterium]|nr:NUDIX domain-containing protein [Deltaproteobacteria bacterium]
MFTTDNLQEIFDVVDLNDHVIGRATRKECNSNPNLIHRAVFILIYNDKNQILWQKRSLTKDTVPGQWVTSASGHVAAGDDYEQTAVREVKEELGIEVSSLEFMGKFLYRYRTENEYSAVFKARSNGPFHYNREEISAIRFMTIAEVLKKDREKTLKLSKATHYIIDSLSLSDKRNYGNNIA